MEEIKPIEEKTEIVNETIYNKKPRFLARLLSGLVDIFIIFLAGFGLFRLEMSLPISDGYHAAREELLTIQDITKLETGCGYKLYEGEENYTLYGEYMHYEETDSESPNKGKLYVVALYNEISSEAKEAYTNSIKANSTYQARYITYRGINYGLLILAAGVAEIIFALIIPLTNKRRATIGRFVALNALISRREVKAKWWQILVRFLFILLIETALPLLYFSELATMLIVGAVNIVIVLISRKTGRTLRDYVSLTMIVDKSTFKSINEQ